MYGNNVNLNCHSVLLIVAEVWLSDLPQGRRRQIEETQNRELSERIKMMICKDILSFPVIPDPL